MSQPLQIIFYDVEHGSSAYLRTPNGKNIVIDLGVGSYKRSSETFSPLGHLWHKYGIRHLDYVIITHPHRDHLDDIDNFNAFNPGVLWTPRHLTDEEIRTGNQRREGAIVERFIQIRTRYSSPVSEGQKLVNPANLGGVECRFFQPITCSRSNLNNHSLIFVISYAQSKIIIPGDNEAASWNELLEFPTFVQAVAGADILVAAHHGREAGYCEHLFEHIAPKLTIVSDGPGSETSAVGKYCQKSLGWDVYSRTTGQKTRRYCLTTASDQTIVVKFGRVDSTGGRYLNVTTA
jgi:beta-lactamase superfamily II metal-dependent hydrolase